MLIPEGFCPELTWRGSRGPGADCSRSCISAECIDMACLEDDLLAVLLAQDCAPAPSILSEAASTSSPSSWAAHGVMLLQAGNGTVSIRDTSFGRSAVEHIFKNPFGYGRLEGIAGLGGVSASCSSGAGIGSMSK